MNRLVDRILVGVVAALAVVLVIVVVGTLQAPVVNAGDKAPDFALVTDQGRTVTPSNFGGKLLVLNFWASWCPPCIEEEPSLQAFQRAYASKGVVVVGVSADRIDKNYHKFLDHFQIGFDTWRDPQAESGLASRYGTTQFPETYVIDSTGHVVIKIPDPQDFTDPDFMARIEKNLVMPARRIGIIHPGEMGSAVAASMQSGGNEVYWASEGRSGRTRERATELGLVDVFTVARLCEVCPAIVSVCPPEFADAVADQVRKLSFRGLYVDANAISPERVRRMDERMRGSGITFVDGSIIGIATRVPGSTWIYFSGESAAEAAACFGSGPIQAEAIDGGIGKASALKMCFAGYSKGTSALLCAVLAAAEHLEVRHLLERQWARMAGSPANPAKTVAGVAAKAWRFAPEMNEIAATLEAAGLPPEFHRAAAEIYSALASFKDSRPDVEDVLRALTPASVSARVAK